MSRSALRLSWINQYGSLTGCPGWVHALSPVNSNTELVTEHNAQSASVAMPKVSPSWARQGYTPLGLSFGSWVERNGVTGHLADAPMSAVPPKVVGLVNRCLNSDLFYTKSISELQVRQRLSASNGL